MQSPQRHKPKKLHPHKRIGYIFYNNKKGRKLKRLCWRWERKNRRLMLKKELNQELELLDLP